MTSGLKFALVNRDIALTRGDSTYGHNQNSDPELPIVYVTHASLSKGESPWKSALNGSCIALGEQAALKVSSGERLPTDDYSCLYYADKVLDPFSSGLVGSLSVGSAEMTETQFALSNWESTRQTSRGRDHLFDFGQIGDSSRGLCHPLVDKASDFSGYETRPNPWANLRKTLVQPNHCLGQKPHRQESENLFFQSPGLIAALPVVSQTIYENGEAFAPTDYNQFLDQPLSLHTNNSPDFLESCSILNDQDETGTGFHLNQPHGDLNSWFGSFDSCLDPLAVGDHSQFPLTEFSLLSSDESSPEAGSAIDTMERRSISPSKQIQRIRPMSFNNCQYCGAKFSRPSELKRHTSKHVLPYRCPQDGCTNAFAQRKDLDRHLSTRKHWQSEKQPLSRVPCYVKGCKFATEGFTRKDNLLRHLRKVHGKPSMCYGDRRAGIRETPLD